MHKILLAAVLALPMTPAFADVTIIGDNGGSITKSRDCSRGDGQAMCTVDTAYLGAEGQTATKNRVRSTERGFSRTEVTLTGPQGNTKTRIRETTWGN